MTTCSPPLLRGHQTGLSSIIPCTHPIEFWRSHFLTFWLSHFGARTQSSYKCVSDINTKREREREKKKHDLKKKERKKERKKEGKKLQKAHILPTGPKLFYTGQAQSSS